jgi:hypothetical protein
MKSLLIIALTVLTTGCASMCPPADRQCLADEEARGQAAAMMFLGISAAANARTQAYSPAPVWTTPPSTYTPTPQPLRTRCTPLMLNNPGVGYDCITN